MKNILPPHSAANKNTRGTCISTLVVCLAILSSNAKAQESTNSQMDECVKKEQITKAALGAVIGAATGWFAAARTGNDARKGAVAGAVVGGAGGWLIAYNTAIDTCQKEHSDWIPEANLKRTKDYARVMQETRYTPSQGITSHVTKVNANKQIEVGGVFDITSTFQVMTPDGAETKVTISRKMFTTIEGKETEVKIVSTRPNEEKTVEPGEHQDTVHITAPPDLKSGNRIRYVFGVSVDGKTVNENSVTIAIK